MEQIKFKVNCKRLDGSSQIAEVTLSETNEITYVNSETPSPYVGFKVEVVSTLPDTGENGVIYLVPGTGTAPNIYDEYVWVEGDNNFECLGTTEISLEGTFNVIKASEIINNTLTDEQYAEITNGKPTLIEGTFATRQNAFILAVSVSGSITQCMAIWSNGASNNIETWVITNSTLSITFGGYRYTKLRDIGQFNGKDVPAYPSSPATDQTLVYKTDNTLAWEDKPEPGKKWYHYTAIARVAANNPYNIRVDIYTDDPDFKDTDFKDFRSLNPQRYYKNQNYYVVYFVVQKNIYHNGAFYLYGGSYYQGGTICFTSNTPNTFQLTPLGLVLGCSLNYNPNTNEITENPSKYMLYSGWVITKLDD